MTSGGGGAIERASEEGRGDILQMTFQIDFSARNSFVLGADGEGGKPAVMPHASVDKTLKCVFERLSLMPKKISE